MPETLWDNGPVLHQEPGVFPMGTDSVLLADFAAGISCKTAIDLGTGTGILSVLTALSHPKAHITAVDVNPYACALAEKNAAENGLSHRITVLRGDLREHRRLFEPGRTDLVISNPPYFEADSGPDAGSGLKDARGDASCSVEELCISAGWATRWGGAFCLIFRPERVCDLFCALRNAGFEPKRMRPVRHDAAHGISLLLVEARRGGNPGLKWEQELILRNPDGSETEELLRIYHRKG